MDTKTNYWSIPLQVSKDVFLEALMQEYLEKILQLSYLIVKDRAIAEDITQEVFIKVYRAIDSFRGESSVKTWLYQIAINEAKKYVRSWSFRQIFSTFSSKNNGSFEEINHLDVESIVLEKINKEEIAEVIMSMSPQYRQVLVLHYYEDLTIKEVAEILQVSEALVRTKLHRARQQFKKHLEKEESRWI